MSRTNRLQELLGRLRHHDGPLGGQELAEALGVPLRTLYQDIAVLRAVGVEIVSEPGQGYVLPTDVPLPPPALRAPGVEPSAELVFYTNPLSRGGIVHWMLEELGISYRREVLDYGAPMKAPDYLAINPMGKVPAIRHGDVVVTEAAAICAYLADAFPEAGLAPAPDRRGAYYRWLFFAAGPLETTLSLSSLLGVHPSPTQEMQLGCGNSEAVIETLAGAVRDRRFIAGDAFSAADVYVGSHIGWGMAFGTLPRCPEFEAYWAGLEARPAQRRAAAFVDEARQYAAGS
ncbi:HTH domain-containing protein [Halomonas sp. THAF12]|uniref:HTH domain-containing protein n=1 Tax=Halomonas sp. B23F22_10 TaxID=3459515 RepID=UPI00373F8357